MAVTRAAAISEVVLPHAKKVSNATPFAAYLTAVHTGGNQLGRNKTLSASLKPQDECHFTVRLLASVRPTLSPDFQMNCAWAVLLHIVQVPM